MHYNATVIQHTATKIKIRVGKYQRSFISGETKYYKKLICTLLYFTQKLA